MTRPIVTVVYAELTTPVVRSQTPPLLRAWRAAGRQVDAAAFTSPRALFLPGAAAAHRTARRALADALGRAPWTRTHLPRDMGLQALGASLAKALHSRGDADSILFCRQPRAALVGIAARARLARRQRRATVSLDLRGQRDDEYLLSLGKTESGLDDDERARLAVYRKQESNACGGADGVLCVSRPMMRAVAQRHGVPESKLGRAPNHTGVVGGAEDLRAAVRKELGVSERALLFVYSGTMAAWQMPEPSAMLVRSLRDQRPDARLLFLTPDPSAAKAAARSAGLDGVLFRSARSDEVARYLCAADYGLLLRDDSNVNRVACPVKFGEYLACGVRPVMTPFVGDQSDLCSGADLGVVVSLGDLAGAAKRLTLDMRRPRAIDAEGRAARRAWARENIAPERIAARIAEFADGIAGAVR